MTEDLLHYIWKYQRFNFFSETEEGFPFEIIFQGNHNLDAGPDFLNAKIRINKTLWAGNVEVHLKSSDWFAHKHHTDKAYNTVILHVVWEHDKPILDKKGNTIPTLVLKDKVEPNLINKYQYFLENKNWIPCENLISTIDPFKVFSWLQSMSISRLQKKTDIIFQKLLLTTNNWETVFYEMLARNFGFNLNSDTFELLAKSLDIKYISKHKNNLFQIEAMLFGQAGLLDTDFADDYPNKLRKEYLYMQHKFNLHPIQKHLWKFLRIRPSNFPTIRIAQFASLIYKSSSLFSKIISAETLNDLHALFTAEPSEYWRFHYMFDMPSPPKVKPLGSASINLLLINTIIPFIFAFGTFKNEQKYKDRALDFLEALKPEQNSIITHFSNAGIQPQSASQSQALIEMYHNCCAKKKCVNCSIGDILLKNK